MLFVARVTKGMKAMNLYQFRLLTNKEQIDLVYHNGVYVGKRKEKQKVVALYQVDGFYVEIFYKRYRQFIIEVRCFTSTYRLQPYLKQIDVEELIKSVS